jgi:hypothetical protein
MLVADVVIIIATATAAAANDLVAKCTWTEGHFGVRRWL